MTDNNTTYQRSYARTLLTLLTALLLTACSEMTPTAEVRTVDSLNTVANAMQYRNTDSAYIYAKRALQAASLYGEGKAEAACTMGRCLFMKMEFDEAERTYNSAHRYTQNETELLIADIGLMQICQRTARNKEFYDHRNSALKRMKRIEEDKSLFSDRRERQRLSYAYAEFRLISALYYYNLRQRQEARAELDCIDVADVAASNPGQYMSYLRMRGLTGMSEKTSGSEEEQRLSEFDNQYSLYRMATDSGYTRLIGEGLLGMAEIMSTENGYLLVSSHRLQSLQSMNLSVDSLLPLRISEMAAQDFKESRYDYGVAAANIAIAQRLNETGHYDEALNILSKAIDSANPLIPERIAAIREQLSVAYAGLGMKSESDSNRNVYLDLLNSTRQDKELESRYAALEAESSKLTIVLVAVIVAFIIMMSSLIYFSRRTRVRSEAYTNRLRRAIALSGEIASNRNSDKLTEEREQLEAQRYVCERHIDEEKRQNIVRKACLSLVYGITPYIDRMINEADKLLSKGYMTDETLKQEKLHYIGELADTINEQNEILSLWIKMRQGVIQLNIENFQLQELFSLVQKGHRSFDIKSQTLSVDNTDCVVKADKALTLFMINTLMENARKYTPDNGSIHVYATSADEYVEISVSDTGIGLSEEDIKTLLNSKVYDSKSIGASDESQRDYLMDNKGGGFGLMNCKGIIEKYRKTNRIFSVCTFGIESHKGKGSRFFFRLPAGVVKRLSMVLLIVASFTSCDNKPAATDDCNYASATDSAYTMLLDSASLYADSVYYANVEHHHSEALLYAEKAIELINRHYLTYSSDNDKQLLKLNAETMPAEFAWWSHDFDTDYHVILDIRNEAAVAFLAMKQLDGYRYNNEAYAGMYKLQGKDTTLESYCRDLERSATNKTIGVVLCIALLVLAIVGYYLLFIRKRVVEVIKLRQLLDINRRAHAASQPRETGEAEALQMEEDTLRNTPQRIVNETFESVNDLLDIETLGLDVYADHEGAHPVCVSAGIASNVELPEVSIPLKAEADGGRCIGMLHIRFADANPGEDSMLFAELLAKYFAIVIYNSVICPAVQYRDIEAAQEDVHRASWEESMLHVQNMVLDNCLSTIKHETVYYPSRIRNILNSISESNLTAADERRQVEDICELVKYYRGIFAILYSCASRQLEEVTFRRTAIETTELTDYAKRYFNKRCRTLSDNIKLSIEPMTATVTGDRISLRLLLESMIDEALSHRESGELKLRVTKDGQYIRFSFTDSRRAKSVDELNKLFTPELRRMAANGELIGTEYLVCKQIIRDHDEYAGRRGCRINAEMAAEGGFTVYFTIPAVSAASSTES